MCPDEKVSLTISISKSYRDRLRTMAAQQNLHDPDQLTTASTIAREIICAYIDNIENLEAGLRQEGQDPELPTQQCKSVTTEENSQEKRNGSCRTTTTN